MKESGVKTCAYVSNFNSVTGAEEEQLTILKIPATSEQNAHNQRLAWVERRASHRFYLQDIEDY